MQIAPNCSLCEAPMKLKAKGEEKFWGCSNWRYDGTGCKGKTMPYFEPEAPRRPKPSLTPQTRPTTQPNAPKPIPVSIPVSLSVLVGEILTIVQRIEKKLEKEIWEEDMNEKLQEAEDKYNN